MSYSCSDFADDVTAQCVELGIVPAADIPQDDPEGQAIAVLSALRGMARALKKIRALPVHPVDDARNRAALGVAKRHAREAMKGRA
jgi:hypothetical protein